MIRDHLDGESLAQLALGVYNALTETASNNGGSEFTTLQGHLAFLAGVSVKSVQRVLPLLREIGVLDYATPKLRGPITFRLLSVAAESRNDTSVSRYVATGEETICSPTIEVTKNKRGEKAKEGKHATRTASSARHGSSIYGFEELSENAQQVVTLYNKCLPNGWMRVTRITQQLSQALERALETGELESVLRTVRCVTVYPAGLRIPKRKSLARLLFDNPEGPDGLSGEEMSSL